MDTVKSENSENLHLIHFPHIRIDFEQLLMEWNRNIILLLPDKPAVILAAIKDIFYINDIILYLIKDQIPLSTNIL